MLLPSVLTKTGVGARYLCPPPARVEMALLGCDEVRRAIHRLDDHECGPAFGLAFSGNAWTHYHVAVVIIAVRRQGALPFGAFPDWQHRRPCCVCPVSPTSSGTFNSRTGRPHLDQNQATAHLGATRGEVTCATRSRIPADCA
jgi:hypothetical protein